MYREPVKEHAHVCAFAFVQTYVALYKRGCTISVNPYMLEHTYRHSDTHTHTHHT